MSAIKNAAQVKDLLTKTLAEDPGKYAPLVNYILVDAFTKLGQLATALADTRKQVNSLIMQINQMQAAPASETQTAEPTAATPAVGAPPPPPVKLPPGMQLPNGVQMPTTAAPPRPPVAPPGSGFTGISPSGAKYVNGVRMGANGEPLSPEEQAIEEKFDQAGG